MSDIQSQAEAVAARIDTQEVGLDPATITLILTTVLPKLFSCLQDNDFVSSSTLQKRIEVLNEKDRPRLIKRTAIAVKKQHKAEQRKQPKRLRLPDLSNEQAVAMAIAIIDQTLELDQNTVTSVSHKCAAQMAALEDSE